MRWVRTVVRTPSVCANQGWHPPGPALRRFVGNLQAFQLGDAVLQLQLAPLQALGFQFVLAIGGHAGDLFIQQAMLGAQGSEAFDDLGGAVGVHDLPAYTAMMTARRGGSRPPAGAAPSR